MCEYTRPPLARRWAAFFRGGEGEGNYARSLSAATVSLVAALLYIALHFIFVFKYINYFLFERIIKPRPDPL